MTKKELVNLVSKNTNVSVKETSEVLDSFFDLIVKKVSEDKINLPIGTFKLATRKARVGRNPQNGEEIQIPASKSLKFRASKAVKEELNK
ncbi:DNA-binding protein HU 1 [Spiroplasma sp. JKS002669]|uniref:HU family DNA-binding protein n=1 Tax=Spiroplasma attinicola TaxID=2904537 RepID=UPI002022FFCE|nr:MULTISPECIES: HU family DNA-binding protein [unclassified Spiroplasma]MCL6428546.1 DNA-binding protein HU 1 [Spiroplasma sp. JKS002669]MCL8209879.1 DNA-binding protein HU 1 [Spiroplasma sp. JKS002670]MCL8210841.1 DNA-binding protein HU 1 [Spiroplasma sp. JKS002671]